MLHFNVRFLQKCPLIPNTSQWDKDGKPARLNRRGQRMDKDGIKKIVKE